MLRSLVILGAWAVMGASLGAFVASFILGGPDLFDISQTWRFAARAGSVVVTILMALVLRGVDENRAKVIVRQARLPFGFALCVITGVTTLGFGYWLNHDRIQWVYVELNALIVVGIGALVLLGFAILRLMDWLGRKTERYESSGASTVNRTG